MTFYPLLSMRGMEVRDFPTQWDKVVREQY